MIRGLAGRASFRVLATPSNAFVGENVQDALGWTSAIEQGLHCRWR